MLRQLFLIRGENLTNKHLLSLTLGAFFTVPSNGKTGQHDDSCSWCVYVCAYSSPSQVNLSVKTKGPRKAQAQLDHAYKARAIYRRKPRAWVETIGQPSREALREANSMITLLLKSGRTLFVCVTSTFNNNNSGPERTKDHDAMLL